MTSRKNVTRSIAAIASWGCLSLSVGGFAFLIAFQVVNQVSPYEVTRQGVLTGSYPRIALWSLFAIEVIAVVTGVGSFVLTLVREMNSNTIPGIVVRNLFGIATGLCTGVVLWLLIGHIVIGF